MKTVKALAILAMCSATHAATVTLATMTDQQLQARWNKQAGEYDEAFELTNCKTSRTPEPGITVTICQTAGRKSLLTLQRKNGQLTQLRLWPMAHPPTDSSMFIRFVRGSSIGNMGAVGIQLLTDAKKSGSACVNEEHIKVCASYGSGEFEMSTKLP